jgi:hypothetical protein
MLTFCTFGSSAGYLDYCAEAAAWVSASFTDSRSVVYTPDDLPPTIRDYCRQNPKGFGFYRWKPWVVYKTALSCQDGDVVLYVDARSGFPSGRCDWLDSFVGKDELPLFRNLAFSDMVVHLAEGADAERICTNADLLSFFGFDIYSFESVTGHIGASFFAIRIGPLTRNFLSSWHRVHEDFPTLCADQDSKLSNHPSFVHNRYDQSVFSLSVKSFARKGLKVSFLGTGDLHPSRSIFLHAKPHPGYSGKSIFSSLHLNHELLALTTHQIRATLSSLDFSDYTALQSDILSSYRLTLSQANLLDMPLNDEPIDADLISIVTRSIQARTINFLELGSKSAKTFIAVASFLATNNIEGKSIAVEYGAPKDSLMVSAGKVGINFTDDRGKRTNRFIERTRERALNFESVSSVLNGEQLNLIYINKVDDVDRLVEAVQLLIANNLFNITEIKLIFSGMEHCFGPNEPKWRLFILVYQYFLMAYKEVQSHAIMIGSELGNHAERTTLGILSGRN